MTLRATTNTRYAALAVVALLALLLGLGKARQQSAGSALDSDPASATDMAQAFERPHPVANPGKNRAPVAAEGTAETSEIATDARPRSDATRARAVPGAGTVSSPNVELSPQEQALLREHPPQTLAQAIFDAEQAYGEADDADRAERQKHYLALLNLAARLAPDPPPPTPEQAERHRRYQQALDAREVELAQLTPDDARRLKETIKAEVFPEP